MSQHILCVGSLTNRRQVVVGWSPAGQQFRVEISRPDDVWLDHLDDGTCYRSSDEVPAGLFTMADVVAQLNARGIELPVGLVKHLPVDAQVNI